MLKMTGKIKDLFKKDFIAGLDIKIRSAKTVQALRDLSEKASTRFRNIFKKDFIIGLDIGTSSVKIAQFEKREDGLYLVKAELKEITAEDNEALREKKIVEILKNSLSGIDKTRSKIIASINCPHTAVKRVTIAYMPQQELRDGINLDAKNYFPFPVDASLLDYEILRDIVQKGLKKYEILLAVSPKATVEKYVSLLGRAGVVPVSLIPDPFALQKLGEARYAKEDKTACFIDIGELHAELVIFSIKGGPGSGGKGADLIFSRKIPVAGKDITRAMTAILVSDRGKTELALDEAEKIKREIGIPLLEAGSEIVDGKISTDQILSLLRTPLGHLVNEIERCLDYYREESGGGKIGSMVLFGRGASLKGLVKFLSEELSLEVKLGDPLEGLKVEPDAVIQRDKISHGLDVAIGAALSEARGINLLPPELKEKTKRIFRRTTFEVTVCVVVFVLAFIYIGMKITLNNYQKRASVTKLELSSLEPQLKEAKLLSLSANEPYWEDIFKELSNLIPGDMYITKLTMSNKVITIKGIAPPGQGEERILNFILALEKGIFKKVQLVTTKEKEEKGVREFTLTCWVE